MRLKKTAVLIIVLLLLAALAGCAQQTPCTHVWQEATCLAPRTCTLCGATEGELAAHSWADNGCTTATGCAVCGTMEGLELVHQWREDGKLCLQCGMDLRTVDEQFIESLAAGLEKRWSLATAEEGMARIPKEEWASYFDAEYEQLIGYRGLTFENEQLGKLANVYIDLIVKSQQALEYYDTDRWDLEYSYRIRQDRCAALYRINAISPIPVSGDNQPKLQALLDTGWRIDTVGTLIGSLRIHNLNNVDGMYKYEAIMENNTGTDFASVTIVLDLYDNEGELMATKRIYIEQWLSGEKYVYGFSIYGDFAQHQVRTVEWELE